MKSQKILYDKYAPMLTIRNDHVDHHLSDKSFPPYHVDYFINYDEHIPKLNLSHFLSHWIYLLHFLHFLKLNFVFSSFKNTFVS